MKVKIVVSIISLVIIIGVVLYCIFGTESGQRMIKDFQSNFTGGLERTVTVYDMEGDVIKEYSGKFDVEYDSNRIKFDDENGKRHVVYYTTGTVVIDER